MKKVLLTIGILIALLIAAGFLFKDQLVQKAFEPNDDTTPTTSSTQDTAENSEPVIISEGLDTPWEIAFLPDDDMLVTERPGVLKRFGNQTAVFDIEGVNEVGEGGLLGLAVHPNYSNNSFIYLYFTTANRTNKVVRYTLTGTKLSVDKTIIENIPGASNHDGGRIAFGPDNNLYITTGDAQDESNAQNTNSLGGKILRLDDDGSIPKDNPFNNPVYSYGHRNPQGLAWDSKGQLWASEHGRSGAASGFDEINLVEKGKNYGWPDIQGDESQNNMEKPKLHSGSNTTWAPADIAIADNTLYFAGLRGQSLYSTAINGTSLNPATADFAKTYGRLRALTIHDGYLYFSTSNRDGRGTPQSGDDKIYRMKL